MTGKWAGDAPAFLEHIYVPGTGFDVYMVVPDNSPNRSGDYCTHFINEAIGSKMPRDLPKVSELGFKLLVWLQPRLFPLIILNFVFIGLAGSPWGH